MRFSFSPAPHLALIDSCADKDTVHYLQLYAPIIFMIWRVPYVHHSETTSRMFQPLLDFDFVSNILQRAPF